MKILVATDGSKPAMHAVKYAVKLLRLLSSTSNAITLISVHDDVGLRHAKAFVGKEAVADHLRELSEKELKPTCCSARWLSVCSRWSTFRSCW